MASTNLSTARVTSLKQKQRAALSVASFGVLVFALLTPRPSCADPQPLNGSPDIPIEGAQRFSPNNHWQPGEDELASNINGRQMLGLALAGGGTRASQIAIGVLEGLYRANVLKDVDVISSVSGGGYAAYWYYSQLLQEQYPADLFRDCVPSRYAPIAQTMAIPDCRADDPEHWGSCICPGGHNAGASRMAALHNYTNVLVSNTHGQLHAEDPFRHQNNLRGHIDLFTPEFSYERNGEDYRMIPAVAGMALTQFPISIPFDGITDVLFDWNTNFSVSKERYRAGIGRIYGQVPVDCGAELNRNGALGNVLNGNHLSCLTTRPLQDELAFVRSHPEGPSFYPPDPPVNYTTPEPISFECLREQYGKQAKQKTPGRLPYWLINATTPVLDCDRSVPWNLDCVGNQFFANNTYPPHRAGFEFSAFSWGSGEHLFRKAENANKGLSKQIDNHGLSLLDAVSASAAFFDPNEKSISLGGVVNFAQQVFGFKWGYYIANPNVDDGARVLHKLLPFPLYLTHRWRETRDSVDIHLVDGGQSDNLGVYPLIRRRVKNIIISDHGFDADGTMDDLCSLQKWLTDPGFAKVNHHRIWAIHFDDLPDLARVCEDVDQGISDGLRYNYLGWRHPVQLGCAVEIPESASKLLKELKSCKAIENLVEQDATDSRVLKLFLIKPAIDLDRLTEQLSDVAVAAASNDMPRTMGNPEILGFLKENRFRYEATETLLFPRHSTISLSLNSSPWLYGVYREVAANAVAHLSWCDHEQEMKVTDAGKECAAAASVVLAEQQKATATLRALDLRSLEPGVTQARKRAFNDVSGESKSSVSGPIERCP